MHPIVVIDAKKLTYTHYRFHGEKRGKEAERTRRNFKGDEELRPEYIEELRVIGYLW